MSYKKKNFLLLIATVVALIFIYFLSITKTLNYKKQYKVLSKEKKQLDNSAITLKHLKSKMKYLDTVLKKENISVSNSFQQIVLKKINLFKKENTLEIVAFNNPIKVIDNGVNSHLYSLSVKGNFNTLLSFVNFLEAQGLGEIKNLKLEKKKNYKTNKEYLQLKLYVKKIITND